MASMTLNPVKPGRPVTVEDLDVRGDLDVAEARAALHDAIEDARQRVYLAGTCGWPGLAAAIVAAMADDLEADIPSRRVGHATIARLGRRAVALTRMAEGLPIVGRDEGRWAA